MKKIWALCWFFVFLLAATFSFAESELKTLKLATYEWPPYQTIENNVLKGICVRVVECALNKMNQPYTIAVVPSKRAQILLEQGEYDAFFSASMDEGYDQFAVRSEPIADQKWNWYTLKESCVDPGYFFFKERSAVSAIAGSEMRKWLEANGYILKTSPYSTQSLFKLLESKRVDAVLASEIAAKKAIEEINLTDKVTPTLSRNKPLRVYFSKKIIADYPDFLNRFNQQVIECRNAQSRSVSD